MTPNDHYMNGQVMLDNINHIRKTIGEIEAYRPSLPLSESGVQSLYVFRRMVVVLREAEMLQKVIMEQNQLLEPIISEISELEKEHEKAQQVSREDSEIKEKAEAMKKQMERLNQKKEVILLAQRNCLIEHLDRLRQEPHDQDLESMLSPVTDGMNLIHMEVQRKDSYFLPSLAEEMEDSTLIIEAADESTDVSVVEPEREEDVTNVPPSSQECFVRKTFVTSRWRDHDVISGDSRNACLGTEAAACTAERWEDSGGHQKGICTVANRSTRHGKTNGVIQKYNSSRKKISPQMAILTEK
ncbi:unnamed protein product [Ranitomeya imitator]|uniref:Uncharacterized protein n=1 Tax=Ranitomeya imitator TaxID=111125 RepID=A0ABN9KXY7_9NEOB|nr:unnamed protein product [Ranitomeya imitator]